MSETGTDPKGTDRENPLRDAISGAIADNEVILFMKGVPEAPACGFSARTVAMLEALQQPFAAVNILPNPAIRVELSELSGWPTIPQLFVRGELVGGCDIVTEMYESGELQTLFGIERDATATGDDAPSAAVSAADPAPLTIENRLS